MRKEFLLIFLVLVSFAGKAFSLNEKRSFSAVRVTVAPKIDGKLDDAVWDNVPVATDFIQYSPYNGGDASFQTEVKVIYDQTALENIRVLNLIFFKSYKFTGNFTNLFAPQNNFINQLIETKKGNPLSLGILYSVIARKLGLPVYGVNLPRNFLLVYLDEYKSDATLEADLAQHILFYINPFRKGAILSRKDIEHFLSSQNIKIEKSFFIPGSNRNIIKRLILNLVSSYEKLGYQDKVDSFKNLLTILG